MGVNVRALGVIKLFFSFFFFMLCIRVKQLEKVYIDVLFRVVMFMKVYMYMCAGSSD